MKAENEKITIDLDEEESWEWYRNPEKKQIIVMRRDWLSVKEKIDDNKYDREKPRHVWERIEAKLRSEAIYGQKWRAPTHMRR